MWMKWLWTCSHKLYGTFAHWRKRHDDATHSAKLEILYWLLPTPHIRDRATWGLFLVSPPLQKSIVRPFEDGQTKGNERLPWPSPALAAPCRISLASIVFYWIFPLTTRPSARFIPPLLSITNDSINHHFHIKSKNGVLHVQRMNEKVNR